MPGETDEEGFPKLEGALFQVTGNSLRLRPHSRRQISKDQECGETTTQQVVILRRKQRTTAASPHAYARSMGARQAYARSTGPRQAVARWSDEAVRSRLSLHLNRINLRRPMPGFMYERPRVPEGGYTVPPLLKDELKKKLFTIPVAETQEEPAESRQGKKIIYISIWKECFYADNIFESAGKDVKAVNKICQIHFIARRAQAVASYIPCFYVKIIVFLMLFIRCFFCKLTFPLAMYYRTYKHVKIHQSCEERGVRPVFTGSACQGPVIYGIRNYCCTFCRAQKQSDVSLKLLEIMNKERRKSQVAR
ncbi:uncharacterized protein LOC135215438 [Macrobrachium nipponense]|uniref:uncharacterized protein LOC135215438 n=1 Tax=Macrobrachium nipponense TaxID=159736 RepID=UPI0030C8297A